MFNQTCLPGVTLITPRVFGDSRGFFLEFYHQQRYIEAGLPPAFVQDNHSHSTRGVLRGLHYQLRRAQGKLIYVVCGEIWDVVVDIRRGSPSFGQWQGFLLNDQNHHQLYVPPGFAHGFCVRSETADVTYKCTDFYDPQDEYGVYWADPDVAVDWQVADPILSGKDAVLRPLSAIPEEHLPLFVSQR